MRTRFLTLFLLLLLVVLRPLALGKSDETKLWQVLTHGVDSNLRAVSADHDASSATAHTVIWAAGSNGVVLRSPDDGKTWSRLHIEGGDRLDFRGLQSFGGDIAYLMSIGENGSSRIYKTTDAGQTWKLQYSDKRPEFFLDGLVCADEKHCFAVTDPIEGKFLLLHTNDGERWKELPRDAMPAALPKEGVFAASNSALTLCGEELFFGTGGPAARVFHSTDLGATWSVAETPIVSGNASSGIFSLGCSADTIVAVGGDYANTNVPDRTAAYSADGGKTWKIAELGPRGFRSAVEVVEGRSWIAVGPTGEDVSTDQGRHWNRYGSLDLNAITLIGSRIVFAVGAKGTVAELSR